MISTVVVMTTKTEVYLIRFFDSAKEEKRILVQIIICLAVSHNIQA